MNLLFEIFAVIGVLALFVVSWWAMIDSQTEIPGVNEPGYGRRKGKK